MSMVSRNALGARSVLMSAPATRQSARGPWPRLAFSFRPRLFPGLDMGRRPVRRCLRRCVRLAQYVDGRMGAPPRRRRARHAAGLSVSHAIVHVVLSVCRPAARGYVMHRWTNAALPRLNAALAVFSLVAQWWQARRHVAAWWLWIVVNTIYIGEYVYKDLAIPVVLYAGLVVLVVFEVRAWSLASRLTDVGPNRRDRSDPAGIDRSNCEFAKVAPRCLCRSDGRVWLAAMPAGRRQRVRRSTPVQKALVDMSWRVTRSLAAFVDLAQHTRTNLRLRYPHRARARGGDAINDYGWIRRTCWQQQAHSVQRDALSRIPQRGHRLRAGSRRTAADWRGAQ